MNKFASTRINQIKQLQALEDIVVELQRKYASELIEYNNKYAEEGGSESTTTSGDTPSGSNDKSTLRKLLNYIGAGAMGGTGGVVGSLLGRLPGLVLRSSPLGKLGAGIGGTLGVGVGATKMYDWLNKRYQ